MDAHIFLWTMENSLKNVLQTSYGGQNATARGAFVKCLERDSVRRRLVEKKLEMATRLLKEAMLTLNGDLLSPRMPANDRADSATLNHLEIVRASARTFYGQHFTVNELYNRVAETFPGLVLDRQTVSRRLFDLRHEDNSVINLVSENHPAGPRAKKGRRYLYNYTGPPC